MKNEFLNCLRIQIVPNHYEEERINNIANFCVKYGFKNVMLFINAEEYYVGHMTIEEAKPWVDTMKRAKKIFVENNLSVSLNPWHEIGHLDRSRSLKAGQNFITMVDYDGNKSETVVCPFCKNWRKYFEEFYTYLLKEIQPDTVWVEDDFRLHNHAPLQFGGCFCEEHMKRYNQKLGSQYTRQEFTDLLFRKKANKEVRKAWLDVNRECMVDLATFIGKTVKRAGNAKVGLMSSSHIQHAMEGRDWHGIHLGLAQGGEMINRLHLPGYGEASSKDYYYQFNRISYICRAFLPKKCKVLPELENGSFSTFTKEAKFLQFQLESAIPLCIDGMTYDIFDFVGNGTVESFGYGQAVKEIESYLNAIKKLSLKYDTLSGIICPIDEKSVYKRRNVKAFNDLYPDEHDFYAYLNAVGLTTKISKDKQFKGQTIALSNGTINNFSNKQLNRLFEDNFVVLDGGAAANLIDRNLGYLIKARKYEIQTEGINSYEQASPNRKVNGRPGYRATMFAKAGNYVNIDYSSDVNALSEVYDYQNNLVGYGNVYEKNFFIIPFLLDHCCREQFHDLRTTALRETVLKESKIAVSTNYSGVYAYLFKRHKENILLLVNSTVSNFQKLSLDIKGIDFNEVKLLSRKDGKKYIIPFMQDGYNVSVSLPLEAMTTCCLILK